MDSQTVFGVAFLSLVFIAFMVMISMLLAARVKQEASRNPLDGPGLDDVMRRFRLVSLISGATWTLFSALGYACIVALIQLGPGQLYYPNNPAMRVDLHQMQLYYIYVGIYLIIIPCLTVSGVFTFFRAGWAMWLGTWCSVIHGFITIISLLPASQGRGIFVLLSLPALVAFGLVYIGAKCIRVVAL